MLLSMETNTRFRACDPNQLYLLPPDLRQWLPADDLVYFILDNASFRKRHLKALVGLFVQVLQLSLKDGLMKLGHVALDGTKVKANTSKHKAMSYGRMQKREKEQKRREKKDYHRSGPPPKAPSAEPEAKRQYNFTDPDSRIMKHMATKSFEQAYNCQAAVDGKSQLIVASLVTQAPNDKEQLEPILEQMEENIAGRKPKKLSVDNGYFSELNCQLLAEAEIDAYLAADKVKKE